MVELRKQNFHTWLWRLSSTNVANAFLHSPRPLQDVFQSFSSLSASRKEKVENSLSSPITTHGMPWSR